MTGQPEVRVEGAAMLALTLTRARTELAALAPEEAGTYIRDQARTHAPFITGRLRASLHSETADARVTVKSDLVYAPVIHNGWPAHGITANPYLIPVAEQTQAAWGRAYYADTLKAISKVRGA
jgi:hypothetical protein